MTRILISALAIVLIGQTYFLTFAQKRVWRVSLPPDRSFSVEVPAALLKVKSFDGEHGVDFDPNFIGPSSSAYVSIEAEPEDCRFGIIVINGKVKPFLTQERKELLEYLSVMLIGDDDDSTPDIEKLIHNNGLTWKEYFFIRNEQTFEGRGSTGSIHTRGRILDAGNKIYILVFVGQDTKELTSSDAERFLNSFRLRRRCRNR